MKLKALLLFSFISTSPVFSTQNVQNDQYYNQCLNRADSFLNIGYIEEAITLSREILSQKNTIDNDSILAEAMNNLGSIYGVYGKNDSCVKYSRSILELNLDHISARTLNDAYVHLGGDKRLELAHDSSLFYFLKGKNIIHQNIKHDSILVSTNLLEISSCYLMLYKGDSAISNCIEAIKYINENDATRASYAYSRISDIFRLVHNYDRAREYGQKSLALSEKTSFKELQINARITLANLNHNEGKYEEAIKLLSEAKEIIGEKESRLQGKIGTPLLRSKLYLNNSLNEEDLEYLQKIKSNSRNEYDIACLDLILLKAKSSDYVMDEFNKNWNQLWTRLDAENTPYYQKVLLGIKYDYYTEKEDWKTALIIKEKIELANETFNYKRQNYAVHELETIYKKKEQDNKIALLDKQSEIQNIKLSNKNKLLWAGGISLAFISLLALFLFKSRKTIAIQKEKISHSLDEKDTLLREIHHRVKNNLQVISSLLRLQSNTTDDAGAIKALKEGQSRVQSMSLIHQNLYQKENLSGINVGHYLQKMCENLFHTYDITDDHISLKTEIENLNLDVDSVVPLGLIINELISNALKYAFPDNRRGTIHIILKEIDNKLHLTIKDNGVGIASMDEMSTTNTFGHRLINSFARKLEAEVNIKSENGTTVKIIISEYKIN